MNALLGSTEQSSPTQASPCTQDIARVFSSGCGLGLVDSGEVWGADNGEGARAVARSQGPRSGGAKMELSSIEGATF